VGSKEDGAVQVNLGSDGLGYLQSNNLAIGLARRPSGSAVKSALAFSLPAINIFVSSIAIDMTSDLQFFAAPRSYDDWETIPVSQLLSAPVARASILSSGATCTFDGAGLIATPPASTADTLVVQNSSPNSQVSLGLAETFSNSGDNSSVTGPSLFTNVGVNSKWVLAPMPTIAYIFTISSDVALGTVLPWQLYVPSAALVLLPPTSFSISNGLAVDLSNSGLMVTYNAETNSFSY
jgi:hypothetical protein